MDSREETKQFRLASNVPLNNSHPYSSPSIIISTNCGAADQTRINQHFLVPKRRVKDFFGRKDELLQIASYFDDKTGQPRVLLLHAIGGHSSSTSTTTRSLLRIAQEFDASAAAALPDYDAKVAFALRTLERWEHRWLMLLDNCDDAATYSKVERFIGCVLLLLSLFANRSLTSAPWPSTGSASDTFTTWTHPESKKFWLQVFVPQQIPETRIMSFGYNTDAAFGQSTAEIVDHAKSLLASLIDKSEESEGR